jgi:hypothetical protein
MSIRRLTLTMLASLCALAGVLALWGASAQAHLMHPYLSRLTGFGNPVAVTVDAGSEVYVADQANNTVDRFNAAGAPAPFSASVPYVSGAKLTGTPGGPFEAPSGVAVDNASGHVYVGEAFRHVVDVFSSSGEYLSQLKGTCPSPGTKCAASEVIPFVEPYGLAVDQATHDLYVTDPGSRVVDVFSSTGENISQFGGGLLSSYDESVAVDELTEDAYVADSGPDAVFLFSPLGSFIPPEWKGASTPVGSFYGQYVYVGLDQTAGRLYVADTQHGVVDEFNASATEEYAGRLLGTPAGPFTRPQAIAASPSGHLYIADGASAGGVVDVFGPSVVVPDVTTGPVSNLKGGGRATLNGTVNPDGAGPASCEFVWGTSESFGKVAPCSIEKIEGSSAVAVSATLTGLQPHTAYYYRLQTTNGNGTSFGEPSQDQHFTALGPGMEGESISNVASSSATLEATINPNGAPTSYYFQYSTTSMAACEANPSVCASVPVAPGEGIGSGSEAVAVTQQVRGLTAGTAYHYRVVVVSELVTGEVETVGGEERAFITQTAGGELTLQDGRAWELVSPANNQGALFFSLAKPDYFGGKQIKASAAGDAITYLALSPTEAQPPGIILGTQVLSRRTASGWSSQDIATPHASAGGLKVAEGPEYEILTEDLSTALVEPFYSSFTPLSPLASEATPYLRRQSLCETQATQGECYLPLVTGREGYADVPPGTRFYPSPKEERGGGGPQFEGADPSLEHVIIKSYTTPLAPAPGEHVHPESLYEWSAERPPAERLQLVSERPAAEGGGEAFGQLGAKAFGGGQGAIRAITRNGSRVFWSNEPPLYMRDLAKGETLRIDVRQPGAEVIREGKAGFGPVYQFTADEGSKVFFADDEPLTTDAGVFERGAANLYECEIVEEAGKLACKLRDLTPRTASGESADLKYIVQGSEDGSYIYFVANGALAPGASRGNCQLHFVTWSETCNLYVLHDGVTKFIATLSGADGLNWGQDEPTKVRELTAIRISPNGRFLTFMSSRSLTGYDNRDVSSGKPDEEVYLYDAQTARLVCASCNPTGARPMGVLNNNEDALAYEQISNGTIGYAGLLPQWTNELYQSRFLSNSGRLFFNSPDALVPQDVNGQMDVYEYEPQGIGNCTPGSATFSATSNGCVGLVSSGLAKDESAFMDASETGDDVFFLTSEKLVAQDTNTNLNVYDAHVCTSALPCPSTPPAPPVCTTAEACRAAPSPRPSIFGAPASATFSGAGNVSPSEPGPSVKPRSLTRAQKLARALRACRARKGRRRVVCERQARARYAARRVGGQKSTTRGGR